MTLLFALPALAHAELVESDPADGATIETPYTLTATFSEDFSADPDQSFIRVQDAGGDIVAEGGHSDQAATMTAELPALPAGEYTVRWQTTTADDNGTERGTFTFLVEASPTPGATPPLTDEPDASATPSPTQAPSPAPSASPTVSNGSSTGVGTDVLVALVIAVGAVGGLAYFLLRRSRP